MSQKKLKKLRKEENVVLVKSDQEIEVIGIREILKNNWKFLVLLCLGIIVLYFNAMEGDFVSDDYATITQNPLVKSVKAGWGSSFFANFYKTLIALIFGIKSPIPFHISSLIMYLLVCITALVFLNLFYSKIIARISLVIFAVLPIHVEAVSWISGEPYLLTSLLVLGELIALVLWLKTKKKKYLVSLLLFLLICFFTDRIRGFSFMLISAVMLITFASNFKIKTNIFKLIPIILLTLVILVTLSWPLINSRIQAVNSGINASDSVFYDPFFQYPTAIVKYLQLLIVPIDLTLYHTMYIIPVWLNWIILIVYLTAIGWFWFKDKRKFFALVFIFAATAPSMAPVKVSWLVAERYIFLGSLGSVLFMAIYIEKWWYKNKILTTIFISVLCSLYAIRVFLRNIDWQTNHNLWVNTCQVSPNSHNAWNNIGDDYDKLASLEKTDEAKLNQYYNSIKGFGQSYAVKPNYADAYHNQANIFYKIGRLDLARNTYETAVKYNPGLFQTYITLLQIDLVEKKEAEVIRHLNIIQQMKPNDLQVAYISAVSYAQIGKTTEAKQLAEMMYKQFPNVAEIQNLYNSLKNLESTQSATVQY